MLDMTGLDDGNLSRDGLPVMGNGFPSHMIDQLVRRFLNKIVEPKPVVHTAPKKTVYFCLPFTGSHSLQIRTQIT